MLPQKGQSNSFTVTLKTGKVSCPTGRREQGSLTLCVLASDEDLSLCLHLACRPGKLPLMNQSQQWVVLILLACGFAATTAHSEADKEDGRSGAVHW